MRRAIFPGSFDPLTLGHVSLIRRGLDLFDGLTVAIAINPNKRGLFSFEERKRHILETFDGDARVHVETLEGLVANFAECRDAVAIIRGLRDAKDFEYELPMAHMNAHLNPKAHTLFLATEAEDSFVSSSLIKEVASLGGDIRRFVPRVVAEALEASYRKS